eukprot:scaffold13461_cov166-Amphora_coffeaeformis.AAC.5
MADLFHLMDELQGQQDESEEEVNNSQVSAAEDEAFDEENMDREIIDLPPALAQAAKGRQQTVEATNEEDDRLDLKDFAVRGGLDEHVEYSQLQHWWVQELQAPELLPWNGEILAPMLEAAFSEEDETTASNNLEAILNDIRCVDKERVQFIVANLLQVRLHKIQACPWFYLEQQDRLSKAELHFLEDFHKLMEKHLRTTVTNHFPQEAWKRLDEPEMIEQPNVDQYVMVRVLRDATLRKGSEEARPLEAGSNLIVNYGEIRGFLESGAVQLIM